MKVQRYLLNESGWNKQKSDNFLQRIYIKGHQEQEWIDCILEHYGLESNLYFWFMEGATGYIEYRPMDKFT